MKLLAVTLGITHNALVITLLSDLILCRYNSSETQSKDEKELIVDIWFEEMIDL